MPSIVTSSEPRLHEAEIREWMSGNLCRCGAYNGIVAAILDVARVMRPFAYVKPADVDAAIRAAAQPNATFSAAAPTWST